jgi:hypothetical protein
LTEQCELCCNFFQEKFAIREDVDENMVIKYDQWESVPTKLTDKDGKEKTVYKFDKVSKEGSLKEVLGIVEQKVKPFKLHCFVKDKQAQYFKNLRDSVSTEEAVLQVDFSENGKAMYQDEAQSGYWNHKQVTVFTASFWIEDDVSEKQLTDSFVVISDSLDHTKNTVVVFLELLLKTLKQKYPLMRTVSIMSDGAASQFKSKFLFKAICTLLPDITGLQLSWHFSATSHGKGACDAVGARAKQAVMKHIMSRKGIVRNAEVNWSPMEKPVSSVSQALINPL